MTVKTNNTKIFQAYTDAIEAGYDNENQAWVLYEFWNSYTTFDNSFIDDPDNFEEATKVTNAILADEKVELTERKYYVRFVGVDTSYLDLSNDSFCIIQYNENSGFTHTAFSKEYLEEHWMGYDRYNTAGLLKFEEVDE
ncbi:hypothetical protein [Lentilactobacillus senioris]|uniref:hypothetical protein n=1 Tax=Lentilactobacillus senioris TaxID=931534 RepID=UPI003D29933B